MITRREWISGVAMLAAGSFTKDLFAWQDTPINFGWLPDSFDGTSKFSKYGQEIVGSGEGKIVRLWDYLELAQGCPYDNYIQTQGTCVGLACSLGATTLDAIQQVVHNKGKWVGHYAAEPIYAGAKIEIGWDLNFVCRCKSCRWKHWNWQGIPCILAVIWMMKYGLCPRGKYGDVDLTYNNCVQAVQWSQRTSGVPKIIERACKKNLLRIAIKIDGGWKQACDIISNGYPIVVGSKKGFSSRRNKQGLLEANAQWNHCTLLWGIDTKSNTQAGCFANSWPENWISGPKYKYPAPPSGFWIEASDVNEMLNEGNSYALSNLQGYPARVIDYNIF